MPETRHAAETDRSRSAADDRSPDAPRLVVGRGRFRSYGLRRLRRSRVLQASMIAAFVSYGACAVLVIWREDGRSLLPVWLAASVVLLSLASWAILFWWFPVLERTKAILAVKSPKRLWIGRALEAVGIGCVAIVHFLLVCIILIKARGG